MIKHIILNLILCCSLVFPAMAQENGEGIRFFEGTWEEALQKAKEENKLIFMDCYSTWCGPCAQMVRKIFPIKEVGDFYNKNFICLKRNMEMVSPCKNGMTWSATRPTFSSRVKAT